MGGRGGSSGLTKGDSDRSVALRKANSFLSEQGISRYDKTPYGEYSTATINHFLKMREQLQEGKSLSDRFSSTTANELLKKITEERIKNAKRVLGSDSDDKEAISYYKKTEKQYVEMEKYVKSKASGTKYKSNSEEDRKTRDAKKYFAEHYNPNRKQREITSSTYERAQKRLNRDVENYLGINRRRKKK